MPPREGIYGLLAEFNTPTELVEATEAAHAAGYRRMECYTPYPVEEAAEALHFHTTRVPLLCLLGGLMGVTTAFLMETWVNVWGYPLNIAAVDVQNRVSQASSSLPAIVNQGLPSSSRRTSGRFCLRVSRLPSE